jgi:hypothetical protein
MLNRALFTARAHSGLSAAPIVELCIDLIGARGVPAFAAYVLWIAGRGRRAVR